VFVRDVVKELVRGLLVWQPYGGRQNHRSQQTRVLATISETPSTVQILARRVDREAARHFRSKQLLDHSRRLFSQSPSEAGVQCLPQILKSQLLSPVRNGPKLIDEVADDFVL
jgi:hypothetical protein